MGCPSFPWAPGTPSTAWSGYIPSSKPPRITIPPDTELNALVVWTGRRQELRLTLWNHHKIIGRLEIRGHNGTEFGELGFSSPVQKQQLIANSLIIFKKIIIVILLKLI